MRHMGVLLVHPLTDYSRERKRLCCCCYYSRFENQNQNQMHSSSQCYVNVSFPNSAEVPVLLEETCSPQESRKINLME